MRTLPSSLSPLTLEWKKKDVNIRNVRRPLEGDGRKSAENLKVGKVKGGEEDAMKRRRRKWEM